MAAIFGALVCGSLAAADPSEQTQTLHFQAQRATLAVDGALMAQRIHTGIGELTVDAEMAQLDSSGKAVLIQATVTQPNGLVVRAARLTLITDPLVLELTHPELVFRGAVLKAAEASVKEEGIFLRSTQLSLCRWDPDSCVVSARAVVLHPGGDLDLYRPALSTQGHTFLALPFLRLRPASKPGFLPPHMAYDRLNGLVIGPAGALPLANDAVAQGFIAAATRGGPHWSYGMAGPTGQLSVRGLSDGRGPHPYLRAGASTSVYDLNLATQIDLPWDEVAQTRLGQPMEQARRNHRSSALASLPSGGSLMETQAAVFLSDSWAQPRPLAATRLWLAPSLAKASFIQPRLVAVIGATSQAPPHANLDGAFGSVEAGLGLAQLVGPVAFDVDIAGQSAATHRSSQSSSGASRSSLVASSRVSLPLQRAFNGQLRHVVTPFASTTGSLSLARGEPWLAPTGSLAGATLGLDTSLRFAGQTIAGATIGQKWQLDPRSSSRRFLRASGLLGPQQLRLHAGMVLDETADRLSMGTVGLSVQKSSILLRSRIAHYGRGSLEALHNPLEDLPGTLPGGHAALASTTGLTVAQQEVQAPLGPFVELTGRCSATFWPRPSIDFVSYGLKLGPRSRCFEVSIDAWHRPNSAVPDLGATLTVPML